MAALAIPAKHRAFFTDAQAEELVAQFQLCDGDGSGAIDEREFHGLLTKLSLHVTPEEAGALVASIDVDGNGLVDFDELVGMVVKIKQGDAQFAKLKSFLEALDATPVALLEREAAKFQLHVEYQLLEERAGTKSAPPVYTMGLTLRGKWIQGGAGELALQAVGTTTREAKFKVAEAALVRVKQLKPGLASEPGDVPPQWQRWLFDNLEAGAAPRKVMQKLRDKGFSPAGNTRLMQRISVRASSLRMRRKRGHAAVPIYDEAAPDAPHGSELDDVESVTPETMTTATARSTSRSRHRPPPRKRCNGLHPAWVHWSQQELARGMDGRVVLDELVAMGFEPHKFPLVAQSFERASYLQDDDGTSNNQEPQATTTLLSPRSKQRRASAERSSPSKSTAANATTPPRRPYCFWTCLQDGDLREVELFVFGGQELNVPQLDAASRLELTPLQLASKAGHTDLVAFLLREGAHVDQRDAAHRTPLLIAAREGHVEICRLLLAHGADLLAVDALGNTPLHCAAASGSAAAAELLLETFDERLLVFLAELPLKRATCLSQILKRAHADVMHAKLRENERRRFHMSWCWDALLRVDAELFGDATAAPRTIPAPRRALMDHVIERYHGRFLEQRKYELMDDEEDEGEEDDDGEEDDHPDWDAGVRQRKAAERAARREWIAFDEMAFCVDLCLREGFKLAANRQGRTALHVACDENLVCTHELVIQSLAETHGSDPELRDHGACTPLDLLLARKGRPGSPRGDLAREHALLEARRQRIRLVDEARERERLAAKRQQWQHTLETLAVDFDDRETREHAKKTVEAPANAAASPPAIQEGWAVYEEPLSRNRLFINAASGFAQRQVPAKLVTFTRERLAWKEKLALHAHFVEQHRELAEWELHRVDGSDVYFFFNRETAQCQWLPPREAPGRTWRTARIFQTQTHLDDCKDAAALALAFSGTFSAPLRQDCVRGRLLGGWRECTLFGVVFYCHEREDRVAVDKPADVLAGEATRYAQVRVRARSEAIEELRGAWTRWYDARSAQSFFFDDATGECVLDVDADGAFLRRVRRPRAGRIRDAQLTPEERAKRLEEHAWRQTLERARQRSAGRRTRQEQAQRDAAREARDTDEHAEALRALEASVTSEHYDEAQGKPLGYVAARFEREKLVFLAARKLDSLPSLNPASARPRHESDRAREISRELDAQEREHAALEDETVATGEPRSVCERRRVARILWKVLERVRRDLVGCRWGCGGWLARVRSLGVHEARECARRRMVCRLGCGLVREDRVWQREIRAHEDHVCDARIVRCPRECGVFLPQLELAHHMDALCMRRPVGDLACRLGCGAVYTGGAHELLALEQQRVAHEQDECALRRTLCTWPQCRAVVIAQDRNAHRRAHLLASGVWSFLTPEIHEYKVPKGVKQLKLQAWGAGGGSGRLRGQTGGHGGGGALVEGVCLVHPGETLYFAIGAGGAGGQFAKMAQNEASATVETLVSASPGGAPGGGVGHSGNKESACGGGGGYTSVYRHRAFGIEYILIAAGGGGGGTCRNGGGGGALRAPPRKDGDDPRVGRVGDAASGGRAGECDPFNPVCRFEGTGGSSLQGGDGAEFGGGGGGGLFGGGGGGFAPGIVGGGGGGSSFVNEAAFERKSVVAAAGAAIEPGGMDRAPPRSARSAYWDLAEGVVGQGGAGAGDRAARGNNGGVRIAKPGFFQDMHRHTS